MNSYVITVNFRYWPGLNACSEEHALSHVMSQALDCCVTPKASELFAMMINHVHRGADSL